VHVILSLGHTSECALRPGTKLLVTTFNFERIKRAGVKYQELVPRRPNCLIFVPPGLHVCHQWLDLTLRFKSAYRSPLLGLWGSVGGRVICFRELLVNVSLVW